MFTNKIAAGFAAAVLVSVAAPSLATQTTFANFYSLNQGTQQNFYWKNSNEGSGAQFNTGTGGQIYSMAAGTNVSTAGVALVVFNFLVGGRPTGINARLQFFGLDTSTPAYTVPAANCSGPTCFLVQPDINGSFSFTADGNQTIGSYVIADGTNLLSATNYTGALTTGVKGGSTASLTGSAPVGGSIFYTSDPMFSLDFTTSLSRGFAISLTGISQIPGQAQVGYNAKNGAALSSFRAFAGGSFDSDPSPTVPEPATWALFIAGFGMVGFQVRRRRRLASVAA